MSARPLLVPLVAGLLVVACDKSDAPKVHPEPPGQGRSVGVAATTTAQKAPDAPKTVAPKAASPRRLCDAPPAAVGRGAPTTKVSHLEAPGSPSLGDKLRTGGGRWTWINFWAAWCAPCKEEIPRLRAFETKLAQEGRPVSLVFMSLDDDERQAVQFLASQPATGLKSSFWLEDGRMRSEWLAALKFKPDPQLPQQLFFDPEGALRCVVDGAIEDGDYEQVKALLARR